MRVGESGGAFDDFGAETDHAFACGVWRQRIDDVAYVCVDRVEIDPDAPRPDAEALAVAQRGDVLGGSDQRLCRHAAAVEAFATHAAFLDQHRRYVARGRSRSDGKTAGAGADHADRRFEFLALWRHQPAELIAMRANLGGESSGQHIIRNGLKRKSSGKCRGAARCRHSKKAKTPAGPRSQRCHTYAIAPVRRASSFANARQGVALTGRGGVPYKPRQLRVQRSKSREKNIPTEQIGA